MRQLLITILSAVILMLGSMNIRAYNLKNITANDGLSNSSILSFGQMQSGLMLFGTCDGVNCFDGMRVYPLPTFKGSYVPGNVIEDIVTDKEGHCWILTNHSLTRLIRGKEIKNYPQFKSARGIRQTADGRLALLQDSTLYCADKAGKTFHRLTLKGEHSAMIHDFAITDKYLYLFRNDGIVRYAMNKKAYGYALGQRVIVLNRKLKMVTHDENTEYIIDNDGLLLAYNLETGSIRTLTNLNEEIARRGNISSIKRFKDQLFIGFISNGLLVIQRQGDTFTKHTMNLHVGVMSMHKDKGGDIMWIGTDGQGVLMYCDEPDTRRSLTHDNLQLRQRKPIRAIYTDDNGTLWVGTKGDGLLEIPRFDLYNTYDINLISWKHDNCGLKGNSVFALLKSRKMNGFWIATDGGLCFYSAQQRAIKPVDTELPVEWISAVLERGDTLWMTTQGMGVYRGIITAGGNNLQLTQMKRYVLDGGEKSSNYFFSMTNATEGPLYLGNRGKGLYIMKGERMEHVKSEVNADNPVGISDIFAILQTKEGLWIGTGGGLSFRTNDGHIDFYDTANGMPSDMIHALTEDSQGNVWASTNKGLVRLICSTHTPRVYNKADNMEVNEYCDGAAFANGQTVFFGGINGLSIIRHDNSQPMKQRKMKFEFTGLSIMGADVNINEYMTIDGGKYTLTLRHDQNTFLIHATIFDFIAPGNYRYYYSFDKNGPWIDNGASSSFNLTQLSTGHHTIYFKYLNTLIGQESDLQQFDVIITPPWYLAWWMKLIYTIIILTIAYISYRRWHRHRQVRTQILETRRKQAQRDEVYDQKMLFLTNLVHELNTPLTLIYGPCERILAHTETDNFVRKYIHMIQANIGRLNYLIKEIIDFRRMSTGSEELRIRSVAAGEWTAEVAGAFNELAETNNINYEVDIDSSLVWNTDERCLNRICTNLISNAFKYSKPGATIRVKFCQGDDRNILLSVYNTGKGIAEKDKQHIFDYYHVLDSADESATLGLTSRNGLGMAICHNAVIRLGGTIDIDSKVGEYACFIVSLPWNDLPDGADTTPLRPTHTEVTQKNKEYSKSHDLPTDSEQTAGGTQPEATVKPESSNRQRRGKKKVKDGNAPSILVIDDNQSILTLLKDTLGDDYNVLTALNGEQGLEVLKQTMPDLIVTDIMMPGIDGLELTQQLKQNKHTMHIPLVILSAKRTDEELVDGLESGADAYVTKPFSTQYLQATIARLLENRNVLREYYNTSASAFTYSDGKLMTSEEREFRNQVVAIIKKNITNADFTPDELAREMNISQRNLYRKFNDAGLPTPKEYIKNFKIEYAARQLDTTNLTIQEIIYASGFNTRSQFYTEFRKHYGITPKEYRERRRVRDDSLETSPHDAPDDPAAE